MGRDDRTGLDAVQRIGRGIAPQSKSAQMDAIMHATATGMAGSSTSAIQKVLSSVVASSPGYTAMLNAARSPALKWVHEQAVVSTRPWNDLVTSLVRQNDSLLQAIHLRAQTCV